jgi:hypothetical protein
VLGVSIIISYKYLIAQCFVHFRLLVLGQTPRKEGGRPRQSL